MDFKSSHLSLVINELVEEKGIDKNVIVEVIVSSIKEILEKKLEPNVFVVDFNIKTDSINVFVEKKIVAKVEDDATEISLKKALVLDKKAQLDNKIMVSYSESLGRIDITRVKTLISQKIKEIEAAAVFKEFADKKGTLINGVISKIDEYGYTMHIHNTVGEVALHFNALLPMDLSIPLEKLVPGMNIRALIKEVYEQPRFDGQIIVERVSPLFIQKLLEIEIPEIFEGIVKIEKLVRFAGYKSKVLVSCRDRNINPVGTCIGIRGSRIQPILKELAGEKMDFILAIPNMEDSITSMEAMVAAALKPAKIESVVIKEDRALVTVAAEERSVAVGKNGRNVLLASELINIPIKIVGNNV